MHSSHSRKPCSSSEPAGAHKGHQEGERTGLQLDSCSHTHARARTHITNPTQADTRALAYQGLEIQQFRERLEDRRRKSLARSSASFDLEDLEDELDEMITLASSSLRLHNECSTEIHRLTEVKMRSKFLAHGRAKKH